MPADARKHPVVLIVDPSAEVSALAEDLAAHEFTPRIEHDPGNAVDTTNRIRPDILLLDADLPGNHCGIAIAREILVHHDLPIVFHTTRSDDESVDQIRSVSRYGYILKPTRPTIVREVLRLALELHREHQHLRQSRDMLESVADLTGDIIVRHAPDGSWTFLNRTARELWGIPDGDEENLNYLDYVAAEDVEKTRTAAHDMRVRQTPVEGLINRVTTPYGVRTYQWNSIPIFNRDGSYAGFQSTGRDITERVESERRVQELLEEREILLREAHHRIKNDLALVKSLLTLEATHTPHDAARAVLEEAAQRIRVITSVYSRLAAADLEGDINLGDLVSGMLPDVAAGGGAGVTVTREITPVQVDSRIATKAAIILNELVTNALKYGQQDGAREIVVRLEPEGLPAGSDGPIRAPRVHLEVRDNGPGFPDDVVQRRRFGFGLTIVSALVSQHGGELHIENRGGGVVDAVIATH